MELMQASRQWATRPADERYTSLTELHAFLKYQRAHSTAKVVPNKQILILPHEDNKGLFVKGPTGAQYAFTHHSFGQMAALAESPAGYLRTLPSPIVADAMNYKMRFARDIEDVGILLYKDGHSELRAATGPRYGRVWNDDVVQAMIKRFGDGVTGDWRVPGEFGKAVKVTKENTTLYAGDRNMFVFLADEKNRVNVPNRRNGKAGSMARGFFAWNSEVGDCTAGIGTFLFDHACCNRIVWGADVYKEIRIRHTASAPLRWVEEAVPVLQAYAKGSAKPVEDAIKAAQARKVDEVDAFLADRFGKRMVTPLKKIHELEEHRPIETLWDITTAVTAFARGINYVDDRTAMEREAGAVMALAA